MARTIARKVLKRRCLTSLIFHAVGLGSRHLDLVQSIFAVLCYSACLSLLLGCAIAVGHQLAAYICIRAGKTLTLSFNNICYTSLSSDFFSFPSEQMQK